MSIRGFVELLRLEQRGLALGTQEVEDLDRWSGVAFSIGRTDFVTPIGEVSEVIDLPRFSAVFGVKPWLIGVAQVRGVILPLVRLSGVLALEEVPENAEAYHASNESSKVIVVEYGDFLTGLVVDRVFGVQHFSRQSYQGSINLRVDNHMLAIRGCFIKDTMPWHVFLPSVLVGDPAFRNPVHIQQVERSV